MTSGTIKFMHQDINTLKKQYDKESAIRKKLAIGLDMSLYYRTHSRYDAALELMQTLLESTVELNYPVGTGLIQKEISLIYYNKLTLDKALEFGFQALTIFKSYGKNVEISEVLCNLGVFYNALNLPEKAKSYFDQSIRYYKKNIPPLINLGEFYVQQGDIGKAMHYFQKTIEIAKSQRKTGDLAYAYKSMGEANNVINETDKAIKNFANSLRLLKDLDEEHTRAFVFMGLSTSYLKQENIDLALDYSFKALNIGGKLANSEIYWFCYHNLAIIYEKTEDYKNANEYHKLSIKLHEKLYSAKITGRIAQLEAVYELERNELETKRLLERSARLASIGTMTAGITHEINQPLNSIVINSEGILYKDDRDKVLPEIYRESVEKIFKSAQRIDQIIKHIRTYWNSGDDLIKNKSVNVNESIDDALGFLNQQILSHGIELRLDYSTDNPAILGNKVHLEQIVVNLITNSIHAVDKAKCKTKLISITTKTETGTVILRIEDNGVGLNKSALDNIFDPFYSTKKTSEGMGLGLSIVKNYVNQMNGDIEIDNKKPPGVAFCITFPDYTGAP